MIWNWKVFSIAFLVGFVFVLAVQDAFGQGTVRVVTAYNVGDVKQTDSTPCTSANNENICEAVAAGHKRCAANFVKLGTKLEIENYGVCTVTDRMNRRYTDRVDVAFPLDKKAEALKFGKQKLKVRVIE